MYDFIQTSHCEHNYCVSLNYNKWDICKERKHRVSKHCSPDYGVSFPVQWKLQSPHTTIPKVPT